MRPLGPSITLAVCVVWVRKPDGMRWRFHTAPSSSSFDQRRRLAIYNDRAASGSAPPRHAQSTIPDCVYDILSSLYYVRTHPLTVGQNFELPLNDGSRTIRLRVDVLGKDEIKTQVGTDRKSTRL